MKRAYLFLVLFLILISLFIGGCEKYNESDEINNIIKNNDLSINMKIEDGGHTIEKIVESDTDEDACLKIDVTDDFSMRGKSDIKPGKKYKLSFTLKNIDADPVISYSFWKEPVTSLRHYTFNGENGNPPSSKTQEIYNDWVTFEEILETKEGEDSLMITLLCGEGLFYINEISIEELS